MELLKHTALELGAMIAKGEISSADVTDAVFAAIEAKDKDEFVSVFCEKMHDKMVLLFLFSVFLRFDFSI